MSQPAPENIEQSTTDMKRSFSRIAPRRSSGPLAPDAMTDHQIVQANRLSEKDSKFKKFLNQYLVGEPIDMEQPVTDTTIFQLFYKKDRDTGQKNPFGSRMNDSYKYGQELYRKMDRMFVWLFTKEKEDGLDPLDMSNKFTWKSKQEQAPDDIDYGDVEKMRSSGTDISFARYYKDVNITLNTLDENLITGPEQKKRITGPVDKTLEIPHEKIRALPPPPKGLPAPSKEELQAAKGRNAARKNATSEKSKSRKKNKGNNER